MATYDKTCRRYCTEDGRKCLCDGRGVHQFNYQKGPVINQVIVLRGQNFNCTFSSCEGLYLPPYKGDITEGAENRPKPLKFILYHLRLKRSILTDGSERKYQRIVSCNDKRGEASAYYVTYEKTI